MTREELNEKALTVDGAMARATFSGFYVGQRPDIPQGPHAYLALVDFPDVAVTQRIDRVDLPDMYSEWRAVLTHKGTGYVIASHGNVKALIELAEKLEPLDMDFNDPASPKKNAMREVVGAWRVWGIHVG